MCGSFYFVFELAVSQLSACYIYQFYLRTRESEESRVMEIHRLVAVKNLLSGLGTNGNKTR